MRHIPVIVCAVCFLLSSGVKLIPAPVQQPTGAVVEALRAATAKDKASIHATYAALEDIVSRDKGQIISTTEMFRELHSRTLKLAFGSTTLVGKYPALSPAIESVFLSKMSLDNVPVTPDVITKITSACREIQNQSGN